MSYTIEYNRQFIKTKNGYIPCWLAGDNNVTEGWGKHERRVREWGIFHNWLDVSEEYMLSEVKKMYNDYDQHWKKGSSWVTNEGLSRWIKNGCKQAGTIEEILEVNPYLRGITCYISYWDAEDNRKQELYSVISSNKGLEEWVNKAKQFIKTSHNQGLKWVFPVIDLEREDLKHPVSSQTEKIYNDTDKFVLLRKGKYLCDVSERGSSWTGDIKEAKVYTYGEIVDMKNRNSGTYIGTTIAESRLVPASKVNSKRFVLKFADGSYAGQYIGKSARGRISLSYRPEGAKIFASKKTAEGAIEKQYSFVVKKYGNLVVDEF
mgnify:CR=1 FL=1